MNQQVTKTLDKICQLLLSNQHSDYIGESVSQLEHALQCAYFAEQSNHSNEVIIAALLHDIGHYLLPNPPSLMAELGVMHHEWIAAKYLLEQGFALEIALLVGFHVEAKRYLAGKKPSYYDKLSEASKGTLSFQGGPLSFEALAVFEKLPYYREILQVRVNDEKGKETDLIYPDLDHYVPQIADHLLAQYQTRRISEQTQIEVLATDQLTHQDFESFDQAAYDLILCAPELITNRVWPTEYFATYDTPLFVEPRLSKKACGENIESIKEEAHNSVLGNYLIVIPITY